MTGRVWNSEASEGGSRRLVVGGGRAPDMPTPQIDDITLNIDKFDKPHVVGDINEAPFNSGSFDSVYFEKVPYGAFTGKNIGALAEVGRLINSGGSLVIETGTYVREHLPDIQQALENSGFENIRVEQPSFIRISATKR